MADLNSGENLYWRVIKSDEGRLLVVADDREQLYTAVNGLTNGFSPTPSIRLDGGSDLENVINHLSERSAVTSVSQIIRDKYIDTVVLSFRKPNHVLFLRTLGVCRDHGVRAIIPIEHQYPVLIENIDGNWATVKLQPWPRWRSVVKRMFDIAFAVVGLIILLPLVVLISIFIKIDTSGPVLYQQERTGEFGQNFRFYKFRTMYPGSENPLPESDDENKKITSVGRILRRTHMDEIPQLWNIISGEMSAVGPRAVWVDEERILQREIDGWEQRYFVKPGLTGLAQINGASSKEARDKLRLDLEYIQRQSLRLDVCIVLTQIWLVMSDVTDLLRDRLRI